VWDSSATPQSPQSRPAPQCTWCRSAPQPTHIERKRKRQIGLTRSIPRISHQHMLHTLGERRAACLHRPTRILGSLMWPGKPGPRAGFVSLLHGAPEGWVAGSAQIGRNQSSVGAPSGATPVGTAAAAAVEATPPVHPDSLEEDHSHTAASSSHHHRPA